MVSLLPIWLAGLTNPNKTNGIKTFISNDMTKEWTQPTQPHHPDCYQMFAEILTWDFRKEI
jgi:hypothetical protein